jgi:protein TonB
MDFARQQRDPTRHVIGITFVVLMHALLVWALIAGLGRKVVEVIKKPLTATIIEEIKAPPPPPPPPPKKVVEQPKTQAPQTYVPPPDMRVPSPVEPVISAPLATPP